MCELCVVVILPACMVTAYYKLKLRRFNTEYHNNANELPSYLAPNPGHLEVVVNLHNVTGDCTSLAQPGPSVAARDFPRDKPMEIPFSSVVTHTSTLHGIVFQLL